MSRNAFWGSESLFQNRDEVQVRLKEHGVPTAVHYTMPLQECFAYLGYKKGDSSIAELLSKEIMSLTMNSYVGDDEIDYINKVVENVQQ